ncbi:MAG TPA: ABC transporter substrate-binding protein [Acidimicrobiales bacterium]|nr:ABC transporter substrate-binding protein [Acidimicrobiales bacterium]
MTRRTDRRGHRARHIFLALALVAAAGCGSRADDGAETESPGLGSFTTDGEAAPSGAVPTPESTMLGDLENPCSGEAAEGEPPADTPGVTADAIRIGVISDKANPTVPLPTVGIEEAVKAFVEFCNAAGGINGRTIELVTYDSQITATDDVTKQACDDDLFALVGSGSVQDQLGIETREACGLPEVAAYSATSARSESADFFQPIPGTRSHFFNVGPCQYMAELYPEAVKKAAIVYTDLPAASVRGEQIRDNCEAEAGFEFLVDVALPFGETNFGPLISQMKSEGIEYFTAVSASSETLSLMREMETQGVELEVIDLGQQYYDPAVAEEAVSEGAYVLTNTVPFAETDITPMLGLYRRYLEEVGAGDDKVSTLGVQAFSAGFLWATAAASLGGDVTRESLVAALEGIHEWDGGGLQMATDPGAGTHNECFLYLRVTDGEFAREFPDEGFECDPAGVVESEQAYEG